MLRARRFPPYPSKPHRTGQARIKVNGKDIYLGLFNSVPSWEEYRKQLALWNAKTEDRPAAAHSVAELVCSFLEHLEGEVRDGQLSEYAIRDHTNAVAAVLRLFGSLPVSDFAPKHLEATGKALLSGSWLSEEEKAERKKIGSRFTCCRKTANHRMRRVRKIFKWGARTELVPWEVFHRLSSWQGFRASQDEKEDVQPVEAAHVLKTLPFLGPVTSAMVRVQWLTGMRSGELVRLTAAELDRSSDVWVYRTKSKTGATAIAIGPKAQAVLAPFLDRQGPLFSPREEMEALREARHAAAKYPRKNRTGFKRRTFGENYTVSAYYKRIRSACRLAGVPHWFPYQLRHLAEVTVERAFDLDYARAVLRHRDPRTTVRYGIVDLQKASEVAAKIG